MRYAYDGWQRVSSVRSPYDTGSVPAVSYSYGIDGAGRGYAITGNKVSLNPGDTSVIQTVIQADGLGRASRTAKTGVVHDRGADTKRTGWNISGAVTATMVRPTLTEYDGLDRVTKTTLSDGSVQSVLYDVTDGGEPYTRTTDPLGNMSVRRTDPAGNIIYVERQDKAGKKLTWAGYAYDATGQMLRATDAKGNAITAEYDLLGRKLSLASVDGGRREYKYDAYRLLEETGSNLRAKGKWIGYEYDGLSRLVKVDYPETAATVYTYGAPGAADNAAGKITNLTDASGTTSYKYGKLGETTEETRTLSVRNGKAGETMTATTGYLSNYLGQMERISYPDGETVEYGYDAGGQVIRVSGRHYDSDFSYVSDIGYDEFGQRSYICYGNGVRTDYEYDPHRRWLSSIGTAKGRPPYQSISYSFDRVGNVLGYKNDCTAGGDYATSQSYAYDDLYQLTSAHGETTNDPFKGGIPDYRSTYDQSYSFDVIGNMTRKTSSSSVYPQKAIGSYLDYDFDYGYAAGFAHRLDHAGGRYYRYDLDGNITMEHHGPIPERLPGGGSGSTGGGSGSGSDDDFWDDWDEDSEYSGSWTGNSGSGSGSDDDFWDDMDGNGQYTGSWDGDMADDGTGSDDGFWDDLGGNGQYNGSWDGEMAGGSGTGAQQDSSILAVYEWDERDRLVRSQTPDVTAYYVYGEDGQRTNKHTSDSETLYFSRLWTWHDGKGAGDQTSKHIYLGSERIVTQMNGWKGQQTYSEELNKTYYYHPDHLGSAQLITDGKGHEYQRIEYTPYGETWVDKIEDPLYVYMPYKFTGKELDEETGLYYYGARYMDPMYSVWISPDPVLGDYLPTAGADNSSLPGMGGVFNTTNCHLYHYAGNNPVRYTDPDGRDIDISTESPKNQNEILKGLQYLTDDVLDIENGKVIINEIIQGDKAAGSELIRSLIENADVTISIKIGAKNSCSRPVDISVPSGSSIEWQNCNSITPVFSGLKVKFGVTPKEINLGHELIHAYHNMKGESKGNMLVRIGIYENPYKYNIAITDIQHKTSDSLEEHITVFGDSISENALRLEHNLPLRATY